MATQNQNSDTVITVISGVLTAYSQAMGTLLSKAGIYSPYTLVKMGVVGSVLDIAQTSQAAQSGNSYEAGNAFFGAVGGTLGGLAGAVEGVGFASIPLAVGGNYYGNKLGQLLWAEKIAPALGILPDGSLDPAVFAANNAAVSSMSTHDIINQNGIKVGTAIDVNTVGENRTTVFLDASGAYQGRSISQMGNTPTFYDAGGGMSSEFALAKLGDFYTDRVTNGQSSLTNQVMPTLNNTNISVNPSGQVTQTTTANIDGNIANVSFAFDTSGNPYVSSVNSINGQPPTDQAAAVTEFNKLGLTPDMLVSGGAGVSGITVSGVVSAFDAVHPTGLQTLTAALTTTIDTLAFIKAIQTGQPLPVVASGLRLANTITGNTSYSLGGAANVAGGVLSLMSLDAALKRGDSMAAITAGAQAISYSASAYVSLSTGTANVTAQSITNAFPNAGSAINGLNTALPYLNIVNSIVHGDAVGAAMGVIAMTPAAPIAWAYYAFQMIDSLFGSTDAPPEAWGSAHAQWTGFTVTSSAVGGFGGLEAASQTYNGMLTYLDQLAAQQQTLNPGSSIGVIANRLPSLSYRNYSGYQITDIDPLTGVQKNPEIKYDLTGRPYNAPAGSVQASQSLTERMIRVALERGAIAPSWEVQTAALQTLAGDPMAGLTEEERAGRAGLLAPQPAAGATTQIFRAVALDLNGDGVQTTGAAQTVAFDVDNRGYLKNTAWLSNSDGFLFLDRNLNGQIDAGSELFSNSAVALGARGLNGMRWVDSKYDGRLSTLDPVWNELKVWQDANGNGSADAGEVQTLGTLGISALDYAMGTFTQNGQFKQLASPDLVADTQGTRTHVVPEGIILQTSQGQTSLLVTRVDDKSLLEANRDGITSFEDTETIISAADLLANDTLAGLSGQNLSITGVSGFTHGTGYLAANGFVHYTPEANYFGAAQFNYTLQASTGKEIAENDALFEMRRAA